MTPPGEPGAVDGFLALAEKLADAAGPIVMESFRRGVATETKADMSPVTAADREAEAAMRALIEAAYPDHGILGEEMGAENTSAEFVWVLDPIDGTQSYVTGKPLFGTLVALARGLSTGPRRHGRPGARRTLGRVRGPADHLQR